MLKRGFSSNIMGSLALTGAILAPPASLPALAAPRSAMPVSAAAADCSLQAIAAPAGATITSVRRIETPVRYCRVDGYVTTTEPGPNRVNFMVSMPDRNNGRYVFTVQGGAAGFVPDPSETYLNKGYAIASTDKGVRVAHGLDFSFRKDPVQALDWAHRGVHVTAGATQAIARAYYGGAHFSRFAIGCSGGGDGTLSNAELYPQDFDGYVAAAMTTSSLEINHIWGAITQHLYRNPQSWISPDELARVHAALLARYDGADGAIDGLIWDPRVIRVDAADLAFLSADQIGLLHLIQDGLKPEMGTSYPGYWLGNVTAFPSFLTGKTRPPWVNMQDYPAGFMVTATGAQGLFGPQYDILQAIDYGNRSQLVADRKFQTEHGRYAFDPARLSGLKDRGGKLILWTGAADQAVPPGNVLDYSEQARSRFGIKGSRAFTRSFFVPGLNHCARGDGAPTDTPEMMLEAVARWVETGKPPEDVVVSNAERDPSRSVRDIVDGGVTVAPGTRTYRLCAWPMRSMFNGGATNPRKLDINDAANWRCVR